MNSFKTLSHLGKKGDTVLQNPVTSGWPSVPWPSKPCHIWGFLVVAAFKTLSHLGAFFLPLSFKTLSHLGNTAGAALQNPVTSGRLP